MNGKHGYAFCGIPDNRFRLRWEIWREGKRLVWQSWTPQAVLQFSLERMKHPLDSHVYVVMQSHDGVIEQKMFRCYLGDVDEMQYHHLISPSANNLCAGIRVKTIRDGTWYCCCDGSVFKDED